ncbi:MAG: phosphatidylglycerophosphatase A, partial [Acidobacteriota bacterium]|nr:phosphatidylglycerophosphatase A [Acidobacteriota bacterium]
RVLRRVGVSIATVGPCGYVPIAPGTVGSAAGVVLFWVVRSSGSMVLEWSVLALVITVGVAAATLAESRFARRDPGLIVVDEVAGMLVTLVAVPVGPVGVVAGFFLFRLFDIVKPYPARQSESLPGGWGVMADDLIAGVYAQVVLRLLLLGAPRMLS